MAYYKKGGMKGGGRTMHNAGSGKMNYAAGMNLTYTNKRNMNMIGRAKGYKKPGGYMIGMRPTVAKSDVHNKDIHNYKKKHMEYGAGMNLSSTNKSNLSGYGGQGKVQGSYNPMNKYGMSGRSYRGRMSMDHKY